MKMDLNEKKMENENQEWHNVRPVLYTEEDVETNRTNRTLVGR